MEIADSILLSRIREDDHSAFDLLFERYWERAYRAARARLDDEAQAQDLVQEIFIKLWQRRHTLAIQTSFEQYLLSAVRLSVISYFRSQKVTHVRLEDALQRVELLENSIHDHSGYLELEQTLEQAVKHMPEMLQKVYELRSENHSVKAIASELGLAEQTVKNSLVRSRKAIRQYLVGHGIVLPLVLLGAGAAYC